MSEKKEFALRCDRCRHFLANASVPMQLMGVFHPKKQGAVPRGHPKEERYRCRSCGYVNILEPTESSSLTTSWRDVSLKQRA